MSIGPSPRPIDIIKRDPINNFVYLGATTIQMPEPNFIPCLYHTFAPAGSDECSTVLDQVFSLSPDGRVLTLYADSLIPLPQLSKAYKYMTGAPVSASGEGCQCAKFIKYDPVSDTLTFDVPEMQICMVPP